MSSIVQNYRPVFIYLCLTLWSSFSYAQTDEHRLFDEAIQRAANNINNEKITVAARQIDTLTRYVQTHSNLDQSRKAYYETIRGNYHYHFNEFDKALSHYTEGIRLAEQVQEEGRIALLNLNVGSILMELQQFEAAEEKFLASIAIHRKLNNYIPLSNALMGLAGIYFNDPSRRDRILPTLAEALVYAKKGESDDQAMFILTNKIQTHFMMGEPDAAQDDIKDLEQVANKLNSKRGKANVLFYKGYVAKTQGKFAEANAYYKESLVYFKETNNLYRQVDVLNAIAENAKELNDYQTAYESALAVAALNSNLFKDSQQKTINELNIKFETEQKEKKLLQQQSALTEADLKLQKSAFEILKQQAALGAFKLKEQESAYRILQDGILIQEKERKLEQAGAAEKQAKLQAERDNAVISEQDELIRSARQRQRLLVFGFSIFALLSGLLIWQFLAARKANIALAKSNAHVELMLKELHHRVKNNLQMVSSLFRLQARRIQDTNTASVLREGQARVEAMSILHQQLYQNEGVTNINLQVYLETLTEKLSFAYGFADKALNVNIQVNPKEIDVDSALPIGLIVNELLTNSFKYAFAETEKPSINIDISPRALHYSDNGKGLPENFQPNQVESFGTRLITSFSQQLNSKFEFWNQDGLNFRLTW